MLLVPSATRIARADTGADDLLRRLAHLLPDSWIVAGAVASKPVSDTCCRGYTRPFDAIIIGDRLIYVLDIWSRSGLIANRQKFAFFANNDDKSHLPEGFWLGFRRETEKLKALLHDRFEVEPGRVVPDKIWSRGQLFDSSEAEAAADTADLRSFARAATRQDKGSSFRPLRRQAVDRIAAFLTEVTRAAPEPTEPSPILFFGDEGSMPHVLDQAPAAPATPVPIAWSEVDSRQGLAALEARSAVGEAAEGAAATSAHPPDSTQAELSLEQGSPTTPSALPAQTVASTEASGTDYPTKDAELPAIAEAAGAEVPSPTNPPDPVQAEVPTSAPISFLPARAPTERSKEAGGLILTEGDAIAPRRGDAARPAAVHPSDGSFDRPLPVAPASLGLSARASEPARAAIAAAAPVVADASENRAAVRPIHADASREQAAPSASAVVEGRPSAGRKWLTSLLLLIWFRRPV